MIKEIFRHVPSLWPHVELGHYDLQNAEEEFIHPRAWDESIEPGCFIRMSMWPMDKAPIPPPPVGGQNTSGGQKSLRRKAFTTAGSMVVHFPGEAGISLDKERYLTLVVFGLFFRPEDIGAEITFSCTLDIPFLNGRPEIQVARTAFFSKKQTQEFEPKSITRQIM